MRALLPALILAAVPSVEAGELPPFRPGLWEFNRSVEAGRARARSSTKKECASPADELKKQEQILAQAGCKTSPATHDGNRHTFTADCVVQGMAMQSTSTLIVESDSSYRIEVASKQGPLTTKEVLVARRIGDC